MGSNCATWPVPPHRQSLLSAGGAAGGRHPDRKRDRGGQPCRVRPTRPWSRCSSSARPATATPTTRARSRPRSTTRTRSAHRSSSRPPCTGSASSCCARGRSCRACRRAPTPTTTRSPARPCSPGSRTPTSTCCSPPTAPTTAASSTWPSTGTRTTTPRPRAVRRRRRARAGSADHRRALLLPRQPGLQHLPRPQPAREQRTERRLQLLAQGRRHHGGRVGQHDRGQHHRQQRAGRHLPGHHRHAELGRGLAERAPRPSPTSATTTSTATWSASRSPTPRPAA